MAAPGLTIPTKFTATGDYVAGVNRMANATDRMLGSLTRMNNIGQRVGLGMSDLTKSMLGYAKSALLIGGAFATARFSADSITEYETAIQSLQAVTGASDSQMVGFKKQISDLGSVSKKNMTDIASSFETVGSAMSQYLEDPRALRQITEAGITLSKAARMELQPSLEALTSVMNQFQLKAESANKTIQTLTAGEIVGAVKTANAAQMLQEFGAVASNMNVNVGESVALIEALGMQMDKSKIGVGARNILTAISAAGGLDKKARMDMRAAGVDMKFLMDNTQSLSARLHELSKIASDPIKMISVFGKENVTAASVIFNQLGTYDKFYRKIQVTAEAETQAATNSRTLKIAWQQLTDKWANMLNTNSDVGSGLNKTRDILLSVADNMESIVSVGAQVVGAWALWKGAILATRGALLAYTAVSQAFFLVDMVKYVAVTKGITTATAAWEIAMASLNTTMLLNPAVLIVGGLVALGGAMYMVNQRTIALTEAYKKQIEIDTQAHIDDETAAVKKLATEYYLLYGNIQKATSEAIKFRLSMIDKQRASVNQRITNTKAQLEEEKNKLYLGDLITGAFGEGHAMYGKREQLSQQLASQESTARGLSANKVAELQFLQSQSNAGVVKKSDFASYFGNSSTTSQTPQWSIGGVPQDREAGFDPKMLQDVLFGNESEQKKNIKFTEYGGESTATNSKLEVVINNQSDSSVDAKSGQTRTKSVMPKTKSTFDVK